MAHRPSASRAVPRRPLAARCSIGSQVRQFSCEIHSCLCEEPPVVIDVDDIQELVASAMSTNDYTPLIRRVGSIFSKHENLTVSFTTVHYSDPSCLIAKGPASMQSPGLDFSGIKECFDLLLNLVCLECNCGLIGMQPNLGSQKSLVNALEIMGRGLKVAAQSFTTPEQLRAMLFMLEARVVDFWKRLFCVSSPHSGINQTTKRLSSCHSVVP